MIAWFARNGVAANLLMVSILIAGLLILNTKIPLEVFPTTEARTISVSVSLTRCNPRRHRKRYRHSS